MHLSTHATAGDAFDPASIRFYDKEVRYNDLYQLKIKPELVVLSACETGVGKWYTGEGAMSVARGFQYAGAQNLLFSLWSVNDFTTARLMSNFYNNVNNHKSFSKNIYDAKLQFIADKTIDNQKKSPYFWAAFVYHGNIEAQNSINFWMITLIYFSLFVVIYFVIKFENSRMI